MAAADGRAAARANSDDPAEQPVWRRLTARHGDRLNEITDVYGWPTAELVGEEAARAAWLIAQHADRQLDVQRRALRLLEQAVAEGSARPREPAFLRDRTLVNEGREQIYGTQIAGVKGGRDARSVALRGARADGRTPRKGRHRALRRVRRQVLRLRQPRHR
ncbi:hypothetical protein GCM10009601_55530 [Streptomyces thermospinosisporus]|uniref:Uncharacterized protein n=1 Tax=Streptomyces thermospinosisporus TaxID=161482 RepID=A0ABP4JWI2_9ACTN